LLLAALATLAGCKRASEQAAAPVVVEPPTALEPVTAAPAAGPPVDDAPPEGVLRAYVWDCDGGLTLNMKNLYRENAITLCGMEKAQRAGAIAFPKPISRLRKSHI
jgi:hypothetical protein